MELAIAEAEQCLEAEVPVGCVIVSNAGEVLAVAGNSMISTCDPTAHAEILAIRAACSAAGNYRLDGCSIFITLEPCAMCMEAIKLARIENVYFGAYSFKDSASWSPNIIGGFYEKECGEILDRFFQSKRKSVIIKS